MAKYDNFDSFMEITANENLKVKVSHKQILTIALPITLAILIPQINMLTNNIFLGRLSEEALGNAGITGVYYLIFAVAGSGLSNAMQTVFSKYAGRSEPEKLAIILTQGIRISLVLSFAAIVFTWFIAPYIMEPFADPKAFSKEMEFLRIRIWGLPFLIMFQLGNAFLISSLNSKLLMTGFLFEAMTNILFDYLLIFGNFGFPALGFNGAAVASVMAECTGMLVVYLVLFKSGLKKRYRLLADFRYESILSKEIIRISLPLVFQYVVSVTTWLVFFILLESRGQTAKAVSNTMRNVFGMSGVFIWAFASACNNMVSNIIGQGKQADVLKLVRMIMMWSMLFTAIMVGALNLFPHLFFRMFGQGENFVQEGTSVIRMVSLGMIFMSMANVWLNAVTGTGRTRVNLWIEIVAIILYMVYTWYFMKVNYISLAVAWSNEFIYWLSVLGMSYWYMRSGRWK